MAGLSTNPKAAAQVVQLLLALLAPAVFHTEGGTNALGRDADSRQASGDNISKSSSRLWV
jgi:hypothetical protein